MIDELKYLQSTVGILICISLICSPLMVVESQQSVIILPLYIFHQLVNHLRLQVHLLNNLYCTRFRESSNFQTCHLIQNYFNNWAYAGYGYMMFQAVIKALQHDVL